MKLARELSLLFGCCFVFIGIGAYDWRLGLIVAGLTVAGGALYGMTR